MLFASKKDTEVVWSYSSKTAVYVDDAGETINGTPVGGQFVTGITGTLEKWNLKASTESYVVVFRNSLGQFVTSVNVDAKINRGWNSFKDDDGNTLDRYEIRWAKGVPNGGQIINSALLETLLDKSKDQAYHMVPGKACPVLALRDTDDGINNGKFLTSVYGRRVHLVSEGKYACYYYATDAYGTNAGNEKLLTWGYMEDLNDL